MLRPTYPTRRPLVSVSCPRDAANNSLRRHGGVDQQRITPKLHEGFTASFGDFPGLVRGEYQ